MAFRTGGLEFLAALRVRASFECENFRDTLRVCTVECFYSKGSTSKAESCVAVGRLLSAMDVELDLINISNRGNLLRTHDAPSNILDVFIGSFK